MNNNQSIETEPQAAVACTELLDELDAIEQIHEAATTRLHKLLRTRGWKYTSNTPGCFWLWEKQLSDGRTLLLPTDMAVTCERMIDSSNVPAQQPPAKDV
jgi:hypothetical protein